MPRNIDLSKYPKEVRMAAHAIGLDYNRPYHRNGKLFYRPYRNRFQTHDKSKDYTLWMDMCSKGYATYQPGVVSGNHVYAWFRLTRKGMDWLGNTIGVIIHNESGYIIFDEGALL